MGELSKSPREILETGFFGKRGQLICELLLLLRGSPIPFLLRMIVTLFQSCSAARTYPAVILHLALAFLLTEASW